MVFIPRTLVAVLILVVAGWLFKLMTAKKNGAQTHTVQSVSVLVETIESTHRPSNRVWSGYGTVRTMQSAQLVAEVAGRVIERPEGIEAGRSVKQGELIVRLDDTDYINALDAARQALKSVDAQIDGLDVESEQTQLQVNYASEEIEAARRDLGRIDEAIAAGAGNPGERDAVLSAMLRAQRQLASLQQQLDLIPSRRLRLQAELSAQRAQERIAQQNVERATIRAPFDSELQSVNTRAGDWVGLGSVVARVVDLSRLEVPLKLPASASSWVREGDSVRLWVREPGGEPDRIGQIVRVAPEADSSSRTITVFVEVRQDPSEPDRLLPGQFVNGRVETHDEHERVILPRRAVQSDTVFVAGPFENSRRMIEKIPVKIAYSFEGRRPEIDPNETQWVALELGYEPVEGSPIVISLLDQVVEGMKVRIEGDPVPDPAEVDQIPLAETQDEDQGGDT